MTDSWNTRTKLVHQGARRSQYGEVAEAIYMTQGFVYPTAEAAEARFLGTGPDEFIYARYGNPTVAAFEERIAAIEGTEDAFATASGMAAVSGALMAMLRAGDHVVAARALFGSCLYVLENVLARYGVEVTLVDGTDLDAWRSAIRDGTKAVFLESVSNPTLEVIDLAGVAKLAHAVGATVVVDNVFCHARVQPRGGIGRGCGDLFGHQAHRRAGPRAWRGYLRHARFHSRHGRALSETYRRGAVAFQRVDHAEWHGHDGFAGARASGQRTGDCDRVAGRCPAGACNLSRSARAPATRHRGGADVRVRHRAVLRGRRRAGGSLSRAERAARGGDFQTIWATPRTIATHPATTTHQTPAR